jgi:hypothetical protein
MPQVSYAVLTSRHRPGARSRIGWRPLQQADHLPAAWPPPRRLIQSAALGLAIGAAAALLIIYLGGM